MKKYIVPLLILILLFSMTGCEKQTDGGCRFYYLRTDDMIVFGQADAVVAPVIREITAQDAGILYLMQRYFEGPSEEGFYSPFPPGTQIIAAQIEGNLLILEVSDQFSQLENIRMTLAGACLTATCHELGGFDSVRVISGEESYEFYHSDYTFFDVIDTQSGKDSQ